VLSVDLALAQRLEAAEEIGAVRYAEVVQERTPELRCAVLNVAGGHAVFAGIGSPLSHAVGIGLRGAVSADEFERLEDFYFSRGAGVELVIAPFADPTLLQVTGSKPYRITEFNSVMVRAMKPGEKFPPAPGGIKIIPPRKDEIEQFDEVVARGFSGDSDDVLFRGIFSAFAAIPRSLPLLAFYRGEAAGGANGLILPKQKLAALYGASTLPAYRGKGIQLALMYERLRLAQKAKCQLACVMAQPGSVSQRNAERAGFCLAYTKIVMVREKPKENSF